MWKIWKNQNLSNLCLRNIRIQIGFSFSFLFGVSSLEKNKKVNQNGKWGFFRKKIIFKIPKREKKIFYKGNRKFVCNV